MYMILVVLTSVMLFCYTKLYRYKKAVKFLNIILISLRVIYCILKSGSGHA